MCSQPYTAAILRDALECEYKGSKEVHAAVGTSLNPPLLPSVPSYSIVGSGYESSPCTRVDSVATTLTAMLYSVKKIKVFIHLMSDRGPTLEDVAMVSRGVVPGSITIASMMYRHRDGEMRHWVTHLGGLEEIGECKFLSICMALQRATRCMVFYWSAESMGYSNILNQSSDTLWARMMTTGGEVERSLESTFDMRCDPSSGLRYMPAFHTNNNADGVVAMGRGGTGSIRGVDLRVGALALCRPVTYRVYSSRSPSGRCFCCQYIVNVHQEIHRGDKPRKEVWSTVELTEKFHQNTTGD